MTMDGQIDSLKKAKSLLDGMPLTGCTEDEAKLYYLFVYTYMLREPFPNGYSKEIVDATQKRWDKEDREIAGLVDKISKQGPGQERHPLEWWATRIVNTIKDGMKK